MNSTQRIGSLLSGKKTGRSVCSRLDWSTPVPFSIENGAVESEKETHMPTYITLAKWTRNGIENIKDSPARLDAFRKVVESNGGKVVGFYMVTGQYDMVIITESPNDEALAKTTLATASKGSVSTETLRAFTEEEYRKIIAALS